MTASNLKAAEQRVARSPQHALDFAESQAEERLRVSTVVPNELVLGSDVVQFAAVAGQMHQPDVAG